MSCYYVCYRRVVPEETSLNFNFYSSNKPAMNGGEYFICNYCMNKRAAT